MLHSRANTKPLLGKIELRLGIIEPLLGKFETRLVIIEPLLGRSEPYFGIIKLVKGLNTKPNLGNVFGINRKSAATELKASLFDDTSVKAVVYLCSQSKRVSID